MSLQDFFSLSVELPDPENITVSSEYDDIIDHVVSGGIVENE